MNSSGSVVEIYVSFLSFNSTFYTEPESIKFDEDSLLNYCELDNRRKFIRKHKNSLDPNVYKHYKWYNSILRNELNFAPEGCQLHLNQCEIESGNFDAFCLNGDFYTKVTIIFGPEMEHWYYSVPGDELIRMCGSKVLEKSHGIFERPDILERRQKQLRPEPNDDLLSIIKLAYSREPPSLPTIPSPPYYQCQEESNLINPDNCFCDNLRKFESTLQKAENELRNVQLYQYK